MTIIVCGVAEGAVAKYRCPCCGMESDDLDAFATSMCWPCSSGNLQCERCLSSGDVLASLFEPGWWLRGDKPRNKAHRMVAKESAACGVRIPYERATGGGSGDHCRRCFPDEVAP